MEREINNLGFSRNEKQPYVLPHHLFLMAAIATAKGQVFGFIIKHVAKLTCCLWYQIGIKLGTKHVVYQHLANLARECVFYLPEQNAKGKFHGI